MDSGFKNPIIPLISDYDPDNTQYIEHTLKIRNDAGREEISQMKVPIIGNHSNDEAFLTFLYKFGRARKCLGWTDGPTLFKKFEMSLEGTFQRLWTRFLDDLGEVDKDEELFDLCVANLVSDKYEDDTWSDMVDYLRSIRKPKSLSAKMLLSRIEEILEATQQLLNAPNPVVSEEELKRIYLKAFPIAWQENFLHSGRSAGSSTLTGIRQYMILQEGHAVNRTNSGSNNGSGPTNGANNNRRHNGNNRRGSPRNFSGHSNNNSSNNNNNRSNHDNNRRNNRGNGNNNNSNCGNNNSNSNNERRRIQESDPCPLPGHTGHTWGRCNHNANNPDRPSRNNNASRPTRDAHATETTNRSRPRRNNNNNNSAQRQAPRFEESSSDAFFITDLANSPDEPTEPTSNDPLDNIEPELLDAPAEAQETISLLTESEFHAQESATVNGEGNTDLIPHVLAIALNIGGVESRFHLISLFDTGSSVALIKTSAVPRQAQLESTEEGLFSTAAGVYRSANVIKLKSISFPEFAPSRRFNEIKCYVFDNNTCPYDLIIGRNILSQAGFLFDFQQSQTTWFDVSVPFHPRGYYDPKRRASLSKELNTARTAALDAFINGPSIKDAIYEVHDPDDVADSQEHLSHTQREQLRNLFRERQVLFSGRIGRYPHRKFHIDLLDGAEPYHCQRPYHIAQVDVPKYRKELERQVELGFH